ncbi:hypothetical protein M9Y10_046003 [Tritrichomonas musculus]|uniref:ADF-H domain-containing protein n=1 Tax=Tritrichomonas musculus TaxID=1915356 RepID=A0ABR2JXW5_9EUKA
MTLGIDLSQEVRDAFQRLRTSRNPNYAILLSPDVDTLKVNLEKEFKDGISLDDMIKELPTNLPRFIIYMPERVHPDGRKSYPLILISYCPPGLPPQVNIVYSNSRTELQKDFQINHIWDITKRIHLGDAELKEKFETNKW